MARKLDFPVFDADNHLYETQDAFTRYLPSEHKGLIKYVEVNGRTKIAVKNKISEYIPNPTFNVVAPPGAHELKYKLQNPDSKTQPGDKPLEAPPRSVPSIPAYFEPEARVKLLDELGIGRAMMWPTLASVLEERLTDDPIASHVVVHAFNQWLHDQWSLDYEGRIFATPVITLPIVERSRENASRRAVHAFLAASTSSNAMSRSGSGRVSSAGVASGIRRVPVPPLRPVLGPTLRCEQSRRVVTGVRRRLGFGLLAGRPRRSGVARFDADFASHVDRLLLVGGGRLVTS